MTNKVYGYIRVSTSEQNEDWQKIVLREADAPMLDADYGRDIVGGQMDNIKFSKLIESLSR